MCLQDHLHCGLIKHNRVEDVHVNARTYSVKAETDRAFGICLCNIAFSRYESTSTVAYNGSLYQLS